MFGVPHKNVLSRRSFDSAAFALKQLYPTKRRKNAKKKKKKKKKEKKKISKKKELKTKKLLRGGLKEKSFKIGAKKPKKKKL
ncbi:hypothetical protein [Clostridium sp. ZBS18]|uniref:hypothetical protein n=1 Tax=Clostridium sp. ZBS18 TaxID=2949967 RepID=UPI00207A2E8B|nr:hypothetical protein [Clostridium sp. ZBS18]